MATWDPESYGKNTRFVSELGSVVLELLSPAAGEKILDLGCGDGVLTRKIVDMGCVVIGADASPDMVSAARREGLNVRVVDAHELSYSGEFDAVFSNAALHWMLRPDAVISGVWNALKSPGRFVGEFGGAGNVSHIHSAMCDGLESRGIDPAQVDPWYFPTPSEYQSRLESAGFEVNYIELIKRPTPLPTGIGGWIESVAHPFLNVLEENQRSNFIADVEANLKDSLIGDDGNWYADYVRLRFQAFRR